MSLDQKALALRIIPRKGDMAFLRVDCPTASMGHCQWSLWQRPASGTMWQWDGNTQAPTITPSIDCQAVGCGRHFVVTKGIAQ